MSHIKKNFAYNSILTIAGYVFPLLTFPYVTRVLGVANIGAVNFIDSIINYLMLFSTLGVGVTGIRAIASSGSDREQRNKVFSSLVTLTSLTTLVTLMVLAVLTFTVKDLRENVSLVGIGMVKLVFNAMLIEWFYRGIEDFKFITLRALLVKMLYVVCIFVFVRHRDDMVAYYAVTVSAIVANALVNMCYSRKFVTFSLQGIELKSFVKPFFAMGAYMILVSTYSTLNVSILGFVTDDTQVGYYTTAVKLYSIILAVFTAFTNVMLPRLSSLRSEGRMDEFCHMIVQSFRVLVLFSVPLIVFSEVYAHDIVRIIAGPGFEGAVVPMKIVMLLLFVVGSNQVFVMQILMPMNDDKGLVRNTFIAAVSSLVLNAIFVVAYKSVGSALVVVGSELILMVLSIKRSKRLIEFKYPFAFVGKVILAYLPLGVILWGVTAYISNMYASVIAGAIVSLIFYVATLMTIFKKEYLSREVLGKILKKVTTH